MEPRVPQYRMRIAPGCSKPAAHTRLARLAIPARVATLPAGVPPGISPQPGCWKRSPSDYAPLATVERGGDVRIDGDYDVAEQFFDRFEIRSPT